MNVQGGSGSVRPSLEDLSSNDLQVLSIELHAEMKRRALRITDGLEADIKGVSGFISEGFTEALTHVAFVLDDPDIAEWLSLKFMERCDALRKKAPTPVKESRPRATSDDYF